MSLDAKLGHGEFLMLWFEAVLFFPQYMKFEAEKKHSFHRRGWKIRRCDSFADMRTHAVRRWQRVSATARTNAAWELVLEAWQLRNKNPDELRLQRVITVLRKA